jgi:hypothetical protein
MLIFRPGVRKHRPLGFLNALYQQVSGLAHTTQTGFDYVWTANVARRDWQAKPL